MPPPPPPSTGCFSPPGLLLFPRDHFPSAWVRGGARRRRRPVEGRPIDLPLQIQRDPFASHYNSYCFLSTMFRADRRDEGQVGFVVEWARARPALLHIKSLRDKMETHLHTRARARAGSAPCVPLGHTVSISLQIPGLHRKARIKHYITPNGLI